MSSIRVTVSQIYIYRAIALHFVTHVESIFDFFSVRCTEAKEKCHCGICFNPINSEHFDGKFNSVPPPQFDCIRELIAHKCFIFIRLRVHAGA